MCRSQRKKNRFKTFSSFQIDASYVLDSYLTLIRYLDSHEQYQAALDCSLQGTKHDHNNLHSFIQFLKDVRLGANSTS